MSSIGTVCLLPRPGALLRFLREPLFFRQFLQRDVFDIAERASSRLELRAVVDDERTRRQQQAKKPLDRQINAFDCSIVKRSLATARFFEAGTSDRANLRNAWTDGQLLDNKSIQRMWPRRMTQAHLARFLELPPFREPRQRDGVDDIAAQEAVDEFVDVAEYEAAICRHHAYFSVVIVQRL